MSEKEFNPDDFDQVSSDEPTIAQQFKDQLRDVKDLPEDRKEEYESLLSDEELNPEDFSPEEQQEAIKTIAAAATAKFPLTDDMRETYIRSLMGNKPYTYTFKYHHNTLNITFRTLLVKEHDAIASAIAEYSVTEGFESTTHLQFMNYKYVLACSLAAVETAGNEDSGPVVHKYDSPLSEYTETFVEKEISTRQLDGTVKTKTVKTEVKDRDRIVQAYTERFTNLDSNLYNLFLNSYSRFEDQVQALATEMYQENFTLETSASSL